MMSVGKIPSNVPAPPIDTSRYKAINHGIMAPPPFTATTVSGRRTVGTRKRKPEKDTT
jgi:hypothetical protein